MSARHPNGWEVGMEVIAVIHRNYGDRGAQIYASKVTKIGRRWITFTHTNGRCEDRFDADTMMIDGSGYGSPGRVYPSMAEYEETLERNKLWADLNRRMSHHPPEHLTLERIKAIRAEVFNE